MSKKVLIIDDNEMILKDVTKKLTEAGFEVVTRNRPLGASQLVIQGEFDLIVLDIGMPVLSGEDLLGIFKESLTSVPPILIFSELETSDLERICREKNAQGFLQKSNKSQLVDKVKALTS